MISFGRAVSAIVWKVAPSPSWSEKSRRHHLGVESRTVSKSVGRNKTLVAPSPHWSEKSRRLRLGPKCRAVSALVWKVASSLPWSRRIVSSSRHLRLGPESRAVSALFRKVAPYAPWSGMFPIWLLKLRRIHQGCKELFLSRAVSACPGKSRSLRLGLDGRNEMVFVRAVSASVWKVAPSPPRSQKFWKSNFCSRWPSRSRRCLLICAVSWVAPYPPWSRKSRRLHLGRKSPEKIF